MFAAIFLLLASVFYVSYRVFLRGAFSLSTENGVNSTGVDSRLDRVTQGLGRGFVNTGLSRYIYGYCFGAVLALIALLYFFNNLLLVGGVLLLLLVFPYLLMRYIKYKRIRLFEKQLPDAIDLMAGSLIAGNSLHGAFALIAEEYPPPLSDEISWVVREQKLGVPVDQSLVNLTERMPYNSVILTVSVIRTSIETGGELSDSLNNVSRTLRSIEQAEGKIRALTSQGKMQAWVVGSMPVFLIMVLAKMEPEAMSKLWSTSEGYMVLGAILILEILGVIFIRKIVNIDI